MKALFPSNKSWGSWVAAMFFVVGWYGVLWGLGLWLFQVAPRAEALPRDLATNLILGTVLYLVARTPAKFALAMAVLMAALQLSNAGKISVLGGPIMPDDFLAVTNLFMLLEGWQLAGAAAIIAVPLVLLVGAVAWRSRRTWILLSGTAALVWAFAAFPTAVVQAMDQSFGNVVWNQRGNFESRGLLLHLTQETARYLDRAANPPSRAEVEAALAVVQPAHALPASLSGDGDGPGRNVHLIVLESFWDPVALTAAGLSEDPIDPAFRALWAQAGHSQALSPVFGGYTANPEFEVLCGFPVTEDRVFFEGGLRRDVPCLPRHLGAAGYRTFVSHPNSAAFWNRVNAYDRIGFGTYWADRDFELDDMNTEFLSDASLYRQVLDKVAPMLDGDRPVFNYILTYFGHLPYPLNDQRPARIETADDSALVHDYVNTMYYKSRELMVFLKVLRERDPDALIVLFGDHLPFLGQNFDGFTDSGLLTDNRSTLTDEMLLTFVATPLVVIDGRRGPVAVGDVPMYGLPSLILDFLGDRRPSVMKLTTGRQGEVVRPLPGMHFSVRDGAVALACRQQSGVVEARCEPYDRWMSAVQVISQDLFSGYQFVLEAVPSASAPAARPAMANEIRAVPAG